MELTFPGRSRIVDPDGRVVASAESEQALIVADLDLEAARTMRVRVPVEKDERRSSYADWQG
jgi:predicted amidohydrolase